MGDNILESSSNGRELPIDMHQELTEMAHNSSGSNSNGKELAIHIPQNMPSPLRWPKCCIYKVNRQVWKNNPKAYTPQVVSIGPIHYKDENLKGTQKLKERYLADFCNTTGKDRSEIMKEIQDQEERIRQSYLDTFDELEKDKFLEIILLDSVFVIEFLRNYFHGVLVNSGMDIQSYFGIMRDLMLMENQLPFFILEHLYNLSYGSYTDVPFHNLVSSFFERYTTPYENRRRLRLRNKCDWSSCFYCFWVSRCFSGKYNVPQVNEDRSQDDMPKHFTDMIRNLLCKNPPKSQQFESNTDLYNVKALFQAGVKFQVDNKAWPMRVKFENQVLKMPPLCFQDNTESLFQNIMVYEQCQYPEQLYFNNYIALLDFLIDTEDDVELLVQSGVVTNFLDNNKVVADLVNNLGKQTVINSCYDNLLLDLQKHGEHWWYPNIGFVRITYFSSIWKCTGTIVGIVFMVFTFFQALDAMIDIFS